MGPCTPGIIPLKAFEGKGTLYDTPGVFLHHRMNSILGGVVGAELNSNSFRTRGL